MNASTCAELSHRRIHLYHVVSISGEHIELDGSNMYRRTRIGKQDEATQITKNDSVGPEATWSHNCYRSRG